MWRDLLFDEPSQSSPPTRRRCRLYVRFTLSYRDVEDPLAERALDVSYETVRRWGLKFGIQRATINAAIVSVSADAAPT